MDTPEITKQRIRKYLEEGKRFDGRNLEDFREMEVETGVSKNAEGSARIKIGKTDVLVGIKMDVTEPYPDSPDKGNLMVSAELIPLSSERFETGPPRIESIELARIIDRFIRESKFINFEKLCLVKGEKVWNVIIDIYSINDDGNLLDASAIGAVVALKNAKIPKYELEKNSIDYEAHTKESIPLKKEIILSITAHKIGNSLILDPIREEEDSSAVRISIGRDKNWIYSMQKGNYEKITPEDVYKAVEMSERAHKIIIEKIKKHL